MFFEAFAVVLISFVYLYFCSLKFGEVLGEGAFGIVLMATMKDVGRDRNGEVSVAVKTLKRKTSR